jgi:hypothetical protein
VIACQAAKLAPEAAEFVIVENMIIADDGKVFGLGLSNKHAVERIFVRAGKESGTGGMSRGDGKGFEKFGGEDFVKAEGEIYSMGEFADTGFSGNFPGRDGAHKDGVRTGTDEFASRWREGGVIGEPP